MQLAITPVEWHAEPGDFAHYRAPQSALGWIDLRPFEEMATPGVPTIGGVCLFGEDVRLDSAWVSIGGTTRRDIDAWEAAFGFRPQGDSPLDLLWDHLTRGSDPSGVSAAKPLMPSRRGRLDMHVGNQQRSERFRLATHPHTAKVLDLVRRDLASIREQARDGILIAPVIDKQGRVVGREVDTDYHRRVMQAMMEKYGVDFATLKPSSWDSREMPLSHHTVLTDDFNRTDSTSIGANWSEVVGNLEIAGNELTPVSGASRCRYDVDLSTVDHYCQFDYRTTLITSSIGGAGCRYAAAADTCYLGLVRAPSSSFSKYQLYKIVGGTATSLGTDNSTGFTTGTVYIAADGSTVTLSRNGAEKISLTDTAITSGLRGGGQANSTTDFLDNFEAGDLALPVTAAIAQTTAATEQSAAAGVTVQAATAQTLGGMASSATAVVKVSAAISSLTAAQIQAAVAGARVAGAAASVTAAAEQQAAAKVRVAATIEQTVAAMVQAALASAAADDLYLSVARAQVTGSLVEQGAATAAGAMAARATVAGATRGQVRP